MDDFIKELIDFYDLSETDIAGVKSFIESLDPNMGEDKIKEITISAIEHILFKY